jgi:hypothetical protein
MNARLFPGFAQGMENRQNGLFPSARIKLVFISHVAFEPRIKNHMNSISLEEKPAGASASQIPRTTDATSPVPTLKTARFPDREAFTEWISMPEPRNESAGDRQEGELLNASLRALSHRRPTDNSIPDLKLVGFSVVLPEAKTVQLAADFTDWDESPLDMIQFAGGIWSTTVPLPAGIYAYRFLVDGEWYDDPRSVRRSPHSLGPGKAFVQVK